MKTFYFLFFLFFASFVQAQVPAPFKLQSPVTIPISISGSFSELRNNHFHAGVDIRTNSMIGLPIVAPADGFVSRITIDASNYGKALYLQHASGITTMYAHLNEFNQELNQFVKKEQYRLKSFEIDISLPEEKYFYKAGDTIAFGGNSGASKSPHLHFEVRQTQSNWVINPFLFGIGAYDNISPYITGICLYPIGKNSAIQIVYNGKNSTYTKNYFEPVVLRVYKSGGVYKLSGVNMIKVLGKLGLGVECHDKMNDCANTLDIYKANLKLDDITIFTQERNTYSMEDTRYIHAHRDYTIRYHQNRQFQRMFLLPNNKITFYKNVVDNGHIKTKYDDTSTVELELFDFYQNITRLVFKVCKTEIPTSLFPFEKDTSYDKLFYFDKANFYATENIELLFPENSFYENLKFSYSVQPAKSRTYSEIHKIHKPDIPVQNAYTIRIRANKLPERLHEKAVIAEVSGESYRSTGGVYNNGWLESKVKTFGNYTIVADTAAPKVQLINFANNYDLKYTKELKISIYDNLSGINTYNAWIDDEWILLEYDKKKNLLTYKFDTLPQSIEHSFKIIVTDKVNNSTEITIKFKR